MEVFGRPEGVHSQAGCGWLSKNGSTRSLSRSAADSNVVSCPLALGRSSGIHSHHRLVNCPGCRPNSLIASALNGQIALALSSGARTRDTSCTAFAGSGSATMNGTYSGSPSPSRRVVTITSCPAVDSKAAMRPTMRHLARLAKLIWLPYSKIPNCWDPMQA